jgi:uncharacterized protein DUF1572
MRSRWTDFLIRDGEKPDRGRDTEFENPPATRAAVMKMWDDGWKCVFTALEPLSDADMERPVVIRGEPHSVMQAINRQIAHYAYHCGQIVILAKHLQAKQWKPLTVPRGKSEAFNQRIWLLVGLLSGFGEFVLMQFHVYLTAPEGDPFGLQPESLFESVIPAQLYGASGAQNALPG